MFGNQTQNRITSGQARKGFRTGHPELLVECPQCHSAIGRRCFMKPGLLGISHTARLVTYQKQQARAFAASTTS
jgi:hypothetical protein